jgi:hypothetical protein
MRSVTEDVLSSAVAALCWTTMVFGLFFALQFMGQWNFGVNRGSIYAHPAKEPPAVYQYQHGDDNVPDYPPDDHRRHPVVYLVPALICLLGAVSSVIGPNLLRTVPRLPESLVLILPTLPSLVTLTVIAHHWCHLI